MDLEPPALFDREWVSVLLPPRFAHFAHRRGPDVERELPRPRPLT